MGLERIKRSYAFVSFWSWEVFLLKLGELSSASHLWDPTALCFSVPFPSTPVTVCNFLTCRSHPRLPFPTHPRHSSQSLLSPVSLLYHPLLNLCNFIFPFSSYSFYLPCPTLLSQTLKVRVFISSAAPWGPSLCLHPVPILDGLHCCSPLGQTRQVAHFPFTLLSQG